MADPVKDAERELFGSQPIDLYRGSGVRFEPIPRIDSQPPGTDLLAEWSAQRGSGRSFRMGVFGQDGAAVEWRGRYETVRIEPGGRIASGSAARSRGKSATACRGRCSRRRPTLTHGPTFRRTWPRPSMAG